MTFTCRFKIKAVDFSGIDKSKLLSLSTDTEIESETAANIYITGTCPYSLKVSLLESLKRLNCSVEAMSTCYRDGYAILQEHIIVENRRVTFHLAEKYRELEAFSCWEDFLLNHEPSEFRFANLFDESDWYTRKKEDGDILRLGGLVQTWKLERTVA